MQVINCVDELKHCMEQRSLLSFCMQKARQSQQRSKSSPLPEIDKKSLDQPVHDRRTGKYKIKNTLARSL